MKTTNDKKNNTARPSTGKFDRKKTKHIKLTQKNENHVKNLRDLQFKNKLLNTNGHEHETASSSDVYSNLHTAVNRSDPENANNLPNLKLDLRNELDDDEEDGGFSDENSISDESDEKPFATSRNISTVKVNQARKPLEQTILDNNSLVKVKESKETSVASSERAKSPKNLSEREKKVSDLVNSIKQKQKQHEKKKQFYSDLKPYIIGGGLLLGGAILFQFYKNFFSR